MPFEYWSIVSQDKLPIGDQALQQRMYYVDLYQCIMNTGIYEQNGYQIIIGIYDKILYKSGSLNSKIFSRTLNSEMTDAHIRLISSVGEAREYFSYLTDLRLHNGGYWELLDSNHFFQAYEPIIKIDFTWHPLQFLTEEEVNWMKEGF